PVNVPFPGAFMVRAMGVPVATSAEAAPAAAGFSLTVAPNPAPAHGTIRLALDRPEVVTVAAYDALGRRVAVLHDGVLAAGSHTFRFEAEDLPSGVYAVRASGVSGAVSRRVTLVR